MQTMPDQPANGSVSRDVPQRFRLIRLPHTSIYTPCVYIYHLFRPYPTDYHLSIHTLPLIHGHVKVVSQSFYHFSLQSLFLHCTICEIPILSSQFQHSEYAQGVGFTDDFSPSPYHNPVFVWMCTHSSWFDLI